jgi:hypothetical protein
MPRWDYRVLRHTNKYDQITYQIHEVYYDKDDKIRAYRRKTPFESENVKDLMAMFFAILKGFTKPILEAKTIKPV